MSLKARLAVVDQPAAPASFTCPDYDHRPRHAGSEQVGEGGGSLRQGPGTRGSHPHTVHHRSTPLRGLLEHLWITRD